MPGFERIGEKEQAQVAEVMDTGVLMRYGFDGARKHYKVKEMESLLTERMQVQHAHLVSSGTAALTVALASAGIGAGDEVIIPNFTFVATFEAILALSAIPVMVNIDDTLTLDPKAVAAAITDKTKAVMPVHMCGSMADLAELKAICNTHRLLLIEDACQAIGGSYQGKPLGSYGDLGCFSFDYVKTITCGEGGAVITNNTTYYKNADHYSDHGHDHLGADRGADKHPFLGYNYRISELHAAVGIAQLKQLDDFIAIQKQHYTILREQLANIPEVTFRRVPEGGEESYAFLNFFMPTEDLARKTQAALVHQGIDACFYWFDNQWHYHTHWEHFKGLTSLGKLAAEVEAQLPNYEQTDFSQSDHWMGRTISCLIKLNWDAATVQQRGEKMAAIVQEVLDANN